MPADGPASGTRGLSDNAPKAHRARYRGRLHHGFEWKPRPDFNNPLASRQPDAWALWIDQNGPWEWFTTHTFKQDVSPRLALRFWDRWFARLSEACRQRAQRPAHARAAVGIEWTTNDRVHLHTVIRARALPAFSLQRWSHRWEGIAPHWCGMSRLHAANGGKASAYLTKYMGKGGLLALRGTWPVTATSGATWRARVQLPD